MTGKRLIFVSFLTLVMGMTVLAVRASAHHSRAGVYEVGEEKVLTLKGTVAEWLWRNPHTFLVVDVPDGKGGVVRWAAESSAPFTMAGQHGLTKNSWKVGDQVIIKVMPARDGRSLGSLYSVQDADGKLTFSDVRRATQGGQLN